MVAIFQLNSAHFTPMSTKITFTSLTILLHEKRYPQTYASRELIAAVGQLPFQRGCTCRKPSCSRMLPLFDTVGLGGREVVGLCRDQGKRQENLQHSPGSCSIPPCFSPEQFQWTPMLLPGVVFTTNFLKPKSWPSKCEVCTAVVPAQCCISCWQPIIT